MSDKPRLGLDIFLALAAIGWADGNLDTDEADAIVRTAIDEGLDLDSIAELEAATKSPVDIGVIDRSGLSKEDRLFVYAVAVWMTRLDGDVSETEKAALAKLGEALKVPEKPRQYAEAIAIEVASLPEGDRPDRYELGKLRAIIADRLHEAQAARAELAAQAAAHAAEQPAAADTATPAEASQSATPDAPADANGAKESALFSLIRAWVARVIDVQYRPSLMLIEKVLLVDDEPDIRRLGALCLKSLGRWVVVTASNGDEAFDVALAEQPDVIVMDVMMPGTDGPTALGKLRSNSKTKDIPVVFLTAVTKPQDIEHLLSLGACGVVAKPFEPKKLPAEIKRCVEQAATSPQSSGGTEHA